MILVVWRYTGEDEGPPMDVAYLEVTDGGVDVTEGAEQLVEDALGDVDRSDQAAVDAAMQSFAEMYNRTSSYSYITIGPDLDHMTGPKAAEMGGLSFCHAQIKALLLAGVNRLGAQAVVYDMIAFSVRVEPSPERRLS